MKKLALKDLSLKNKRVLMRVDFNVPLAKDGTISDDSRIRASFPSIRYILDHGASLILMSHLGRPDGKRDPKLSLTPVGKRLSELLKQPIVFAPDCIGPTVESLAHQLRPGNILLLENLRFHQAEEEPEKEPSFVTALASLGDLYVNDAFGTAHRAHASTALIAKHFPNHAAAGFLMEKEIAHLAPLLDHPAHPFYAIIGGAKVSTKVGVIHNLLKKVDALFIGGAMAFTFFKAQGIEIGDSLFEESELKTASQILSSAKSLFLPTDIALANSKIISIQEGIPKGQKGMDIGPNTIEKWSFALKKGATVFWNGPLGVFEKPPFDKGTRAIAETLSQTTAEIVVGGGDSIAAIQQMGLENRFSHLSTGGGASLEFLEFGHLPGIDALTDAP